MGWDFFSNFAVYLGNGTTFLAAILAVQRRRYNVIDFYQTLSKFAVLLRKCSP